MLLLWPCPTSLPALRRSSVNTWDDLAGPVGPGTCLSWLVLSGLWSADTFVMRAKLNHLFFLSLPNLVSAPGPCLVLSLILRGDFLTAEGKAGISRSQVGGWNPVDLSEGLGRWQRGGGRARGSGDLGRSCISSCDPGSFCVFSRSLLGSAEHCNGCPGAA